MSTGYELRLTFFGPLISRACISVPARQNALTLPLQTGFWVLRIAEVISLLAIPGLNIRYLTSTNIHLTSLSVLGFLCTCRGALIRYQCYHTLGKFFIFERSLKSDHSLVTSGPYTILRHPSYLGKILNTVGMMLWCVSPGSWVRESGVLEPLWGRTVLGIYFSTLVGILGTLLWRMPKEDATLRGAFGKQWNEWARGVPYMVLPGIF